MNYRLSLVLLILSFGLFAQKPPSALRLAFYNVENLFHPEVDSLNPDREYTPDGKRNWSFYRYHENLKRCAQVMLALGEGDLPAMMSFAEIENKRVLEDLCKSPPFAKTELRIVHYDSPDRRGIDVALLYRPDRLRLLYSRPIPVRWSEDPEFRTRDMLYTQFELPQGDTLHSVICHWPSRYGGQAASEPKRIAAAAVLRALYDSLAPRDPYFLVMGDFNDEWHNRSLREVLAAGPRTDSSSVLINYMAEMPMEKGSHRYQGQWAYLDQIVVSAGLQSDYEAEARVFEAEFLLEEDNRYPGHQPFRTYRGLRYHGGFSDHLPIFIDLQKAQPK